MRYIAIIWEAVHDEIIYLEMKPFFSSTTLPENKIWFMWFLIIAKSVSRI